MAYTSTACIHGVWDETKTNCTCDPGWVTGVDQDVLSGHFVYCNSNITVIPPNTYPPGEPFAAVAAGNRQSIIRLVVILLGIAAVFGVLGYCTYCCLRCCRKRRRREETSSPQVPTSVSFPMHGMSWNGLYPPAPHAMGVSTHAPLYQTHLVGLAPESVPPQTYNANGVICSNAPFAASVGRPEEYTAGNVLSASMGGMGGHEGREPIHADPEASRRVQHDQGKERGGPSNG